MCDNRELYWTKSQSYRGYDIEWRTSFIISSDKIKP